MLLSHSHTELAMLGLKLRQEPPSVDQNESLDHPGPRPAESEDRAGIGGGAVHDL